MAPLTKAAGSREGRAFGDTVMASGGDFYDGNNETAFGADAAAPPDAMKLDATTEATLARSLSALPPDGRRWITFAEARITRQ